VLKIGEVFYLNGLAADEEGLEGFRQVYCVYPALQLQKGLLANAGFRRFSPSHLISEYFGILKDWHMMKPFSYHIFAGKVDCQFWVRL
jgi:hypothetical protein